MAIGDRSTYYHTQEQEINLPRLLRSRLFKNAAKVTFALVRANITLVLSRFAAYPLGRFSREFLW